MAQSPLLGNRISLISKKNIRYEGTLYSINEADATVALADVKSYGTEGRDKLEPLSAYVPQQDAVHPYLLFRGCDIKDLHVHENQDKDSSQPASAPSDATTVTPSTADTPSEGSGTIKARAAVPPSRKENMSSSSNVSNVDKDIEQDQISSKNENTTKSNVSELQNSKRVNGGSSRRHHQPQPQLQPRQHNNNNNSNTQYNRSYNNNANRRSRKNNQSRVGTGASLLNRKERGAVEGPNPAKPGDDFDFVSSATEFQSRNITESSANPNIKSPYPETNAETCYSKDDFFDSISCDTLDKQSGYETRLRGSAERSLNTETFGAVSLGSGRRGGRRRGARGGRGRGRGGHANSGRGRTMAGSS